MITQISNNTLSNGYLRQSQLIPHIVPISSSTLWRRVKDGTFPAPIKLSERITAWRIEDINNWMVQFQP